MPIAIAATAATAVRRPRAGIIVDASVGVKWVMAEPHAEAALRLLECGAVLTAPAHWLSEAVNAIWAACRRGDLAAQEAYERAAALAEAPVAVVQLDRLAASAMTIALRLGVTIYDALYLALAEYQNATLITDDRRLLAAAHGDGQLRDRTMWIGDGRVTGLHQGSR